MDRCTISAGFFILSKASKRNRLCDSLRQCLTETHSDLSYVAQYKLSDSRQFSTPGILQGRFACEAAFCEPISGVHASGLCEAEGFWSNIFINQLTPTPLVQRHHEMEYVPIGLEAAQNPPNNKRGFLWRFRRVLLRSSRRTFICSCCQKSRGEVVEEVRVIEF